MSSDDRARVDLSFRLAFWADVGGIVLCTAMIWVLRRQRAAAKAGLPGAGKWLVLPIYEPVLWALLAVFTAQALILGIPGPYPQTPAWFLGAIYSAGQETQQWKSSLLYWAYWSAFELMSEGFGLLILQPHPSPETFAVALKYGALYAAAAAGLTTVGFNYQLLGISEGAQMAIDSTFLGTPCLLYGTMLLGRACTAGAAAQAVAAPPTPPRAQAAATCASARAAASCPTSPSPSRGAPSLSSCCLAASTPRRLAPQSP
jgi:hypothetical protein